MQKIYLLATFLLSMNWAFAQTPRVAINEIVASNEASASDEAGEFDDWIELFNNTNETINLTGYTLSDNPDNLAKWMFPDDTSISANGYLIVWADEDGDKDQGPLHASFKLAAGGEVLFLVDPSGNVVDELTFGQQEEDVAFARVPNGTGEFRKQAPTFNADNESNAVYELRDLGVNAFPVPATETLNLTGPGRQTYTVTLYNMVGRRVFSGELQYALHIDVRNLPAGNYVLRVGEVARKVQVR